MTYFVTFGTKNLNQCRIIKTEQFVSSFSEATNIKISA